MSQLDMACAELRHALQNQSAVERYLITRNEHPGWVEMQNKCSKTSTPKNTVYL